MTSLIVWSAADSRGVSSLNIATDSRISWKVGPNIVTWDHGQKIFASKRVPLVAGIVGDVTFPALVIPRIIDHLEAGFSRKSQNMSDYFYISIRRVWKDYPQEVPALPITIYVAYRVGSGMSSEFKLIKYYNGSNDRNNWSEEHFEIPKQSQLIVADGSGKKDAEVEIQHWGSSPAGGTSRAIFSGFVDGLIDNRDPASGGAPQLGCIYRNGNGRLLGVLHIGQRFYEGSDLLANDELDSVEWRNDIFERVSGETKRRIVNAQVHEDYSKVRSGAR